ncbi:AI-2E family transporter [Sphingomicrobium marinum]|uniref:AI-2E family transporter n=1 Tax=Sphingomicrobium marinum TaxID=1227950 RepID=UPI00223F5803|nr:AI-2E family transporter [Sphingomicrobium marinum]
MQQQFWGNKMDDSRDLGHLAKRTLIVLLLVGLGLLLVPLASTLLLIFGAVLIAVLIRAAGTPFRMIGLSDGISVLLGLLTIFVIIGLAGWLFGAQLSGQFAALQAQLTEAFPVVRDRLSELPLFGQLASSTPDFQGLAGQALGFAFGFLGLITNLVLVIVGAVYFALEPRVYAHGTAKLFPKSKSDKVIEAMDASGVALKRYLVGQLATMTLVGLMVGIGLSIVGVPSAAALGIMVGLANFIPLIGPFIGAIPGLIIAFSATPELFWYAVAVYLVAQQIEGNVLTPLVQQRAVSIPPALLIFALAALGALFGLIGVVLAAPLTVVIYTLVSMLWSRDALGHDVKVPGCLPEETPKEEEPAAV